MTANRHAIYIDSCLIVYRTKVYQYGSAMHLGRNGKFATVPQNRVNLVGGANTTCRTLIAEWYGNGLIKLMVRLIPALLQTYITIVKSKFPFTI